MALDDKVRAYLRELGAALNEAVSSSEKVHEILAKVKAEGYSRITWEITPIAADSCRLVVTHDQLRDGANDQLYGGWPMILSGLKTVLETGESLTTPGSLMYS